MPHNPCLRQEPFRHFNGNITFEYKFAIAPGMVRAFRCCYKGFGELRAKEATMPPDDQSVESVLIVDDEEPVRKTFREWLEGAGLGCRVLTAPDAEAALIQANRQTIDLAILDWNLGAGNDGLRLLEDLAVFNPDIVAIMITGFAHQATPLDAMRMGVRDYFDKNQNLDRSTFLQAVRRQLESIRPAKRERQLYHGLVAFRSAVEKVLPLVRSAAALNDPVPLSAAVRHLFRFLQQTTGAADGVLLVHAYDASRTPSEDLRAYGMAGDELPRPTVPFSRSLAGGAVGMQEPAVLAEVRPTEGTVELQPFEQNRINLMAAPLNVAAGVRAVLELFDKRGGFTDADRRLAAAAAEFGAEMLRQALAERQSQRTLFDAVEAALGAGDAVARTLVRSGSTPRPEDPPPPTVLDQLKRGLSGSPEAALEAGATLRLAEAVRVLALRHGPKAVDHCTRLVESVRALLDEASGAGEAG
jgi:two-component system, NtrC family, nitrogen regulation response regulator NtrX